MLMPAQGAVVDARVADGDRIGHRDFHAGGLLLDHAEGMEQAVFHAAIGGIVIALRPGPGVDPIEGEVLAVLVGREAHGLGVAHEADRAGPGLGDLASGDLHAAVVIADEYRVAADGIEKAIGQAAIFRPLKENRAAAVNAPIASQQRLVGFHERPGGVGYRQAAEGHEPYRLLPAAAELDQTFQPCDLDAGLGEIDTLGRHEIQGAALVIEEPFAGGVELFEDVLHETVFTVHAHLAVVLPAALEPGVPLGIHARDAVVEVAPFRRMQGMHETAFGMRPFLDPLRADGVGRGAAVDPRRDCSSDSGPGAGGDR